MLARYYEGEYETRLARIMLFRSSAFNPPFCKPGFAGEWDMNILSQCSHEDGLQRGLIFFPDVKSMRRLDWGAFDTRRSGYQDPVLLKAMLGDFHAEFIALFLCEILLSQCIHFTHREAGEHIATEVFCFPNNRMIPRLLGFMGFNSHPSLIIELNRKCLHEKADPIFKEHLFGTSSFSVKDLDALLGNSAKVVMERVKRFPIIASFKKNIEPALADNPNFYLCGQFAPQITELYYHEVSEIQRSLEELCYNGEP